MRFKSEGKDWTTKLEAIKKKQVIAMLLHGRILGKPELSFAWPPLRLCPDHGARKLTWPTIRWKVTSGNHRLLRTHTKLRSVI
jgi:hypothetical protein